MPFKPKFLLVTIITFAINFTADRITKIIASAYLKGSESFSFLYDTVVLTYTENAGAFLGMGADWHPALKLVLLLLIPIPACLYGLYYSAFREDNKVRAILITTIVTGGLGNLIDRLFNDFRVVDFLNFGIGSLRTGVLNVADMSVTFGVLILVIYELFKKK